MVNDILRAVAIANGLVILGASALSIMSLTPPPLDVALGIVAASTFAITGWLATFTIKAVQAGVV